MKNPAAPILFIAGADDPLVLSAIRISQRRSIYARPRLHRTSRAKSTYPKCATKILNERGKLEVWTDILSWIETHSNPRPNPHLTKPTSIAIIMKPWLIFTTRRPRRCWAGFTVNRPETGLSDKEVQKRQQTYGEQNVLKSSRNATLARNWIEPFVDIFMIILVVALGAFRYSAELIEAITIGVIIAVDAIIYYIQRFQPKKFLNPSKNSTIQTITVLRDGEEQALRIH